MNLLTKIIPGSFTLEEINETRKLRKKGVPIKYNHPAIATMLMIDCLKSGGEYTAIYILYNLGKQILY